MGGKCLCLVDDTSFMAINLYLPFLKGGCNLIYVETFEIYEEVEKTIDDKCM